MNSKRFAARSTAVALGLGLVAGVSAGVFHDAGGWPAVAAVWISVAILVGAAHAIVWGLSNWNA